MEKSDNLKLTLVQFSPFWENPQKNLDKLESLFNRFLENTDVIILPELFTTGFTLKVENFSETMNGNTINWMKKIAAYYKSAVCGTLIVKETEVQNNKKVCNYYNRLIWVNPSGKKYHYDKKHLFSFAGEDKYYSPGMAKNIIRYKNWEILPLICYDLRFPVWSRYGDASSRLLNNSKKTNSLNTEENEEYDLLIYVANWPEKRSNAWKQLLIARAIENQSYVAGVNRTGKDGNGFYHSGNSSVIDFDGRVFFSDPGKESVKTIAIKKNDLIEFRKKYPFLKDRD